MTAGGGLAELTDGRGSCNWGCMALWAASAVQLGAHKRCAGFLHSRANGRLRCKWEGMPLRAARAVQLGTRDTSCVDMRLSSAMERHTNCGANASRVTVSFLSGGPWHWQMGPARSTGSLAKSSRVALKRRSVQDWLRVV